MSNNTTILWCHTSDAWINLGQRIEYASYYILTIIYLTFGLIGRTLSLLSVYKQIKSDEAYLYQIMLLINEIFEILSYGIYAFMSYWRIYETQLPYWFRDSYFLAWLGAYFTIFPQEFLTSCTLSLTLVMSLDRIFCLARPYAYKNLPHKKIRWSIWSICIILSVLTNLHLSLIFRVSVEIRGNTTIYGLQRLQYPTIQYIGRNIYSVYRITLTCLLFLCNFLLYLAHRKRAKEKINIQKNKTYKTSKTLFKMTMCQSILTTIGQMAMVSCQIGSNVVPDFRECYFTIWGGLADGIKSITDTVQFYCLLIISRSFRELVKKALTRLNPFITKVQSMSNQGTSRFISQAGR